MIILLAPKDSHPKMLDNLLFGSDIRYQAPNLFWDEWRRGIGIDSSSGHLHEY
jgi:hypothetical protein